MEMIIDRNLNWAKVYRRQRNRVEILENEYGCSVDELIHDINPFVRVEVAKCGYGLNTLIHDASWLVRLEVAKQYYGLATLMEDRNQVVRSAVLARMGITTKNVCLTSAVGETLEFLTPTKPLRMHTMQYCLHRRVAALSE